MVTPTDREDTGHPLQSLSYPCTHTTLLLRHKPLGIWEVSYQALHRDISAAAICFSTANWNWPYPYRCVPTEESVLYFITSTFTRSVM